MNQRHLTTEEVAEREPLLGVDEIMRRTRWSSKDARRLMTDIDRSWRDAGGVSEDAFRAWMDRSTHQVQHHRAIACVYLVHAGGTNLVKIGVTDDLAKRARGLRFACPVALSLIAIIPDGDIEKERELHRRFEHLRSHGEWFRFGHDLFRYLMDELPAEWRF